MAKRSASSKRCSEKGLSPPYRSSARRTAALGPYLRFYNPIVRTRASADARPGYVSKGLPKMNNLFDIHSEATRQSSTDPFTRKGSNPVGDAILRSDCARRMIPPKQSQNSPLCEGGQPDHESFGWASHPSLKGNACVSFGWASQTSLSALSSTQAAFSSGCFRVLRTPPTAITLVFGESLRLQIAMHVE